MTESENLSEEKYPWRNEENLRQKYYKFGNLSSLADEWDTYESTIRKWMDKFDIDRFKLDPSDPLYDKEVLRELYQEENSIKGVCERLPGNKSPNAVIKWMDNFGIERNKKHSDRGEKVDVCCAQCDQNDRIYQSVARQNENYFCCVECMGKYYSEHNRGKNHPSWKGGSDQTEFYSGGEWRKVRSELRSELNCCEKCGINSDEFERELDAHHIKPIRKFENPHDAHTKSNLVLLCRSCHNEVESELTIKEQLEIFKNGPNDN
jgi:5-methylcytosine-specific restriction endonuclease McrA